MVENKNERHKDGPHWGYIVSSAVFIGGIMHLATNDEHGVNFFNKLIVGMDGGGDVDSSTNIPATLVGIAMLIVPGIAIDWAIHTIWSGHRNQEQAEQTSQAFS